MQKREKSLDYKTSNVWNLNMRELQVINSNIFGSDQVKRMYFINSDNTEAK